MNKRKKSLVEEINLTPLLDALFSILFIVMLSGIQSEKIKQGNISILEEKNKQLKYNVSILEENNQQLNNKVKTLQNINQTIRMFEADTVIITLRNYTKFNEHRLFFYLGKDDTHYTNLLLTPHDDSGITINYPTYIKNFITAETEKKINESKSKRPIYIVFHCNIREISRKREYLPIKEVLEELEKTHAEVFCKIVDE